MNWTEVLALPSVRVLGTEKQSDRMIFEVEFTNGSATCPECNRECTQIHAVKLKRVKDLHIMKFKCFIRFHHRRFYCTYCDKTFMERLNWVDHYERYTSRYAEKVAIVGRDLDVKKTANLLDEQYRVVERIVYYREKEINIPEMQELPSHLGIDEFAYRKGKKDYGVVLATKGNVCHVLPSRKEPALRAFFSKITASVRESVVSITMDMWNTFINLAEEFFPNAAIVIDRFHVMKLLNKAVDKVRKTVQKTLTKEERKKLKGLRWILLRNHDTLKYEEYELLKKAFTYSPTLHKVYLRKEEFRNIFEKNTDKKKAEHQLDEWIQKASTIQHRSMTTFLKTLAKRKKYILNYFNHYESNGFMEGIMNKIKTIKRQHYGIPTFAHLKRKIMMSFT
jgi:transposase